MSWLTASQKEALYVRASASALLKIGEAIDRPSCLRWRNPTNAELSHEADNSSVWLDGARHRTDRLPMTEPVGQKLAALGQLITMIATTKVSIPARQNLYALIEAPRHSFVSSPATLAVTTLIDM